MITNLPGDLAKDIRLVFRFVYIILFAYIGLVGTQANRLATQLSLLRTRKVDVAHATGWLQGVQLWAPLVRMRRIPHLKWWLLMAFIALMAKVADLSNVTIEEVYHYTQCEFGVDSLGNQTGKGMVISGVNDNLVADTFPKSNTQTFILAGNAQLNSIGNDCGFGVFWKADQNSGFCAAKEDVMGWWNCTSRGDLQYPSPSTSDQDLIRDLQQRGLLYENASYNLDDGSLFTDPTTVYDELVVWSASAMIGTNFTVLAAVDRSNDTQGNKIMHSMYCYLEPSPWAYLNPSTWPDPQQALLTISKAINTTFTLEAWAATLGTYMYNGKDSPMVPNPEFWLEWLLNNMIMVSGSNDQPTRPPPVYSQGEGCYKLLVRIPNGVIFLILFTFLICLIMTGLIIWQYACLLRHADRNRVRYAPADLWTWMSQAVAERYMDDNGNYQPIEATQLNQYNIELTANESLRIERKDAVPAAHVQEQHGRVEMEEMGKPVPHVAPPMEV